MKPLPARPNLEHLKKQAKDLLASFAQHAPDAIDRVRQALPAASHFTGASMQARPLRLADAQSCIAREYGFKTWSDLRSVVEAMRQQAPGLADIAAALCRLVYAGDVVGTMNRSRPEAASRLLAHSPPAARDPWVRMCDR